LKKGGGGEGERNDRKRIIRSKDPSIQTGRMYYNPTVMPVEPSTACSTEGDMAFRIYHLCNVCPKLK